MKNSRIRAIDISGKITTAFGGQSQRDCIGSVETVLSEKDLEQQIKASSSVLCYAYPTSLAISHSCSAQEGTVSIAFSQMYWFANNNVHWGRTGNIMVISRPCPRS